MSTPVVAPKGYSIARWGEPMLYSAAGHLSVAASKQMMVCIQRGSVCP